MNQPTPFDRYADEYDGWFDENPRIYEAELRALRRLVPSDGTGVEIGIGTGRFAIPLGIMTGVDPAPGMLRIATAKGLSVSEAAGENLPFRDGEFDFALLVTVICFVEGPRRVLEEAKRVVRPGGSVIVAFIDKESALGRHYEARKDTNKFYQAARFYSTPEVVSFFRDAGLTGLRFCQTILGLPGDDARVYDIRDGYGDGAFVVVSGRNPSPAVARLQDAEPLPQS